MKKISKNVSEENIYLLNDIQNYYIDLYNNFKNKSLEKHIDELTNFFVDVFFKGDKESFYKLVGDCSYEKLSEDDVDETNIKYKILLKKVNDKDFKAFLLLNLISCNSKYDALIIHNDFSIELYKFY